MRVTGQLKFFSAEQNYGFLVADDDGKDVFFHFDDMKDTELTKDDLSAFKERAMYKFIFNKLMYLGRHGLSLKAININLIESVPLILPQ